MNNFNYSARGLSLTERFEGLRHTSYQDIRGIWTIGFGHTGKSVGPGQTITMADAIALLRADIASAVACVNQRVTVPLNQNRFDALVDFVFNVGSMNFIGSTLLKKLDLGDFAGAAAEFPRWDHAGTTASAPLLGRRDAEQTLFLQARADRELERLYAEQELFLEAA